MSVLFARIVSTVGSCTEFSLNKGTISAFIGIDDTRKLPWKEGGSV